MERRPDTGTHVGVEMHIISKAVVKLYRAGPRLWTEVGAGTLVWCAGLDGCQYYKMLRWGSHELLLDEELHEEFEKTYLPGRTTTGTHAFHTFELGNDVRAARGRRPCERPALRAPGPRASPHVGRSPSPAAQIYGACFSSDSDAQVFAKQVPVMAPLPRPPASPSRAGDSGGLFGRMFGRKKERGRTSSHDAAGSASAPEPRSIGRPTNVMHVRHIGWDEQAGARIHCIVLSHAFELRTTRSMLTGASSKFPPSPVR